MAPIKVGILFLLIADGFLVKVLIIIIAILQCVSTH